MKTNETKASLKLNLEEVLDVVEGSERGGRSGNFPVIDVLEKHKEEARKVARVSMYVDIFSGIIITISLYAFWTVPYEAKPVLASILAALNAIIVASFFARKHIQKQMLESSNKITFEALVLFRDFYSKPHGCK